MNKTSIVYMALGVALVSFANPSVLLAAPNTGEAVVAGKVGAAQARVFTGPVHEGRTELHDINEGTSIGETSRLITGKDGRLCVILSPGAILCIAPETELTFSRLRHTADGLPEREDDLIRRIHLELHKGRILVHAGVPTSSLDIKIKVDAGAVEANGGTFVVAQNAKSEWAVINEEYDISLAPLNGTRSTLAKGDAATMSLTEEGKGTTKKDQSLLESPKRNFEVCNAYFQDLEPFIQDTLRFDRQGLNQYLGASAGSVLMGDAGGVSDVSPSFRPVTMANIQPPNPDVGSPDAGARWDKRRIWAWFDSVGVIKGVNYVPRNAVNSTEMWLEESFDADLIDEELGWAQNAGYTAVRVQLQYVVWKNDPTGFVNRLDKFLDIARQNELRVVPVMFDDLNLAGTEPNFGPQPDPVPGKNNARWTPSPGALLVKNRDAWPDLETYVTSIMNKFKRDDRVLYWDLYNTAGNGNLWEDTLPLMDQTFNWARKVNPEQPLAVAAWTKYGSAMSARKLERSDIITFQSFDSEPQVEPLVMMLQRYDRPIICSDWLLRQRESNFEKLLPLFATHRIGWFNQGLVNGKTQAHLQQPQYQVYQSEKNPDLWQHDVLKSNGEAYDSKEINLIQAFRYLEGP